MDIHVFNPVITLSRYRHCNGGDTFPARVGIRHIAEVRPKSYSTGSEVYITVNGAWTPNDSIWDVAESPEKIADLIAGAVARWHLDSFPLYKEQKRQDPPAVETLASEHNEQKEAQNGGNRATNVVFDRMRNSPAPEVLDGSGWPVCTGPYGAPTYAKAQDDAHPLEIPGKDATRPKGAARCLHCGDYVHLPEHDCPFHPLRNLPYTGFPPTPDRIEAKGEPVTLEGVSEAGDDRYKYAEGTGTVSMGKLREALGALQHPGAQVVAKGMAATSLFSAPDRVQAKAEPFMFAKYPLGCMEFEPAPAKDPLREALAKFADSLNSAIRHRPEAQITPAELEEYIIKTLEAPGSTLTLQIGGNAYRRGRPVFLSPELRINFPPDRGD